MPTLPSGAGHSKGFTLVELMVTLLVGSVITVAMWTTVYQQNLMMMQHSDEADIHRRANATFDYIGRHLREAGSSMATDGNALGIPFLGPCTSDTTTVGAASQKNCTKIDNGGTSDRFRTLKGFVDSSVKISSSTVNSADYCDGSGKQDLTKIHFNTNIASPSLDIIDAMVISGTCTGSSLKASDALVWISVADRASSTSKCYEFSFTNAVTNNATLSCANGYAKGYTILPVQVSDFFLAAPVSPATTYTLTENVRERSISTSIPIAPAVNRLQITYGIDTTTPINGKMGVCSGCTDDPFPNLFGSNLSWCRDPRASDSSGNCNLKDSSGNTLTTQQIYSRIVAAYVEMDFQRATSRASSSGGQSPQITRTYRRLFALNNRL